MDMNRLINMIINAFVRKFVNKAVNSGINYASRGGKPKAELTDAERQQAQTGKDMAKRAKDRAKVARRIGLK